MRKNRQTGLCVNHAHRNRGRNRERKMTATHPSDCGPAIAELRRAPRTADWPVKLTEIAVAILGAILGAIGLYAIALLALLTAQGIVSF